MIRDAHRKMCDAGKPVTFSLIGGEPVQEALTVLRRENVPVYTYVDQAVSSIGALLAYRRHLVSGDDQFDYIEMDGKKIEEIAGRALEDGRNFLLAGECREIMEAADIPLIESRFCRNLHEVIGAADELGYPLAMKVVSRDVHRKRDVGGVVLDLENQEEIIDAFEAIKHNVRLVRNDAVIEGVEVSPMVDTGLEINISAKRDPHFGPVVISSLGGIISETGGNRSIRNYPLNRNHVRDMLEETGAYPLLLGARWEMRRDIDSLVDLVLKTGAILEASESIVDIEIDPVAVYEKEKGLMVLDVGIVLKKQGEETL
jgi:acyl-CoA synthetase (NDP forming)